MSPYPFDPTILVWAAVLSPLAMLLGLLATWLVVRGAMASGAQRDAPPSEALTTRLDRIEAQLARIEAHLSGRPGPASDDPTA